MITQNIREKNEYEKTQLPQNRKIKKGKGNRQREENKRKKVIIVKRETVTRGKIGKLVTREGPWKKKLHEKTEKKKVER